MALRNWLRCWRTNTSSQPARRPGTRLGVHPLEDRTVPSWVAQIGGPGADTPQTESSGTVDSAGNVYAVGQFEQSAGFGAGTGAGVSLTSAGGSDGYAAKYAPTGELLWARRFGGSLNDSVATVGVDPVGQFVYVAGGHASPNTDLTGDGLADVASAGASDFFVAKLDAATGATVWWKSFGSVSNDHVYGLAASGSSVYLTGNFTAPLDFDPGPGARTLTPNGYKKNSPVSDGYVLRLSDAGSHLASWQIGGKTEDFGIGLAADGDVVYVNGTFTGTADFDPGSAVVSKTIAGAVANTYVARYTVAAPTPQLDWVQTIATGISYTGGLAADAGSLYLQSAFKGAVDFDPGSGVHTLNSGANPGVFAARYTKAAGALNWVTPFTSPLAAVDGSARMVVDPTAGVAYLGMSSAAAVDLNPGQPGGEHPAGGYLVKVDATTGGYLASWAATESAGGDTGTVRPLGTVGGTVYATGWLTGTITLPTGDSLTSAGSRDAYVMAFDPAPSPSPLMAAALPVASAVETLTAAPAQPVQPAAKNLPPADADGFAPPRTIGQRPVAGSYHLPPASDPADDFAPLDVSVW